MHAAFSQNLGDTPVRHNLVQFHNLPRNIGGLIFAVLKIHGAHHNHELIYRLLIDQEFTVAAVIDISAQLILNNLDICGTEESTVQGIG